MPAPHALAEGGGTTPSAHLAANAEVRRPQEPMASDAPFTSRAGEPPSTRTRAASSTEEVADTVARELLRGKQDADSLADAEVDTKATRLFPGPTTYAPQDPRVTPSSPRALGFSTPPTTPLRDADIRAVQSGGHSMSPRPDGLRPVEPGRASVERAEESDGAGPRGRSPREEHWRELAQRLRQSHPPPFPEPRHPREPPTAPAPPQSPPVPPRATTAGLAVPPGQRPARAPELVIGNLEVRVVPAQRAPHAAPSPPREPRRASSGAWQTAARHYLGRL